MFLTNRTNIKTVCLFLTETVLTFKLLAYAKPKCLKLNCF